MEKCNAVQGGGSLVEATPEVKSRKYNAELGKDQCNIELWLKFLAVQVEIIMVLSFSIKVINYLVSDYHFHITLNITGNIYVAFSRMMYFWLKTIRKLRRQGKSDLRVVSSCNGK